MFISELFLRLIEFLQELFNRVFEGPVRNELGTGEVKTSDRGNVRICKPILDGLPFIGKTVISDDRILHKFLANGAQPFLRIILFLVFHVKIFILIKDFYRLIISKRLAKKTL